MERFLVAREIMNCDSPFEDDLECLIPGQVVGVNWYRRKDFFIGEDLMKAAKNQAEYFSMDFSEKRYSDFEKVLDNDLKLLSWYTRENWKALRLVGCSQGEIADIYYCCDIQISRQDIEMLEAGLWGGYKYYDVYDPLCPEDGTGAYVYTYNDRDELERMFECKILFQEEYDEAIRSVLEDSNFIELHWEDIQKELETIA